MKLLLAILIVSNFSVAGPIYSSRDDDLNGGVGYIIWTMPSTVVDDNIEVYSALLTPEGIIRCVGRDLKGKRCVIFGKLSTTKNDALWASARKLSEATPAQRKPKPGRISDSLAIVQPGSSSWEHRNLSDDENVAGFVKKLRDSLLKMETVETVSLSAAEFRTIKELRRLNKIDPEGTADTGHVER